MEGVCLHHSIVSLTETSAHKEDTKLGEVWEDIRRYGHPVSPRWVTSLGYFPLPPQSNSDLISLGKVFRIVKK